MIDTLKLKECSLKLSELENMKARKKMLYQWVKTDHITAHEFIYLFDFVVNLDV